MIQPAAFIPDVIPDETVYSICSRYHQLSGSPSWSATNTYLFGISEHRSIELIPSRLGHFAARFADLYRDALDVMNHHTAFPYFRAFMVDKERECPELQAFIGTGKGHHHWGASHIKNAQVLRYCEACLHEQLGLHRRTAWLRSLQFPGVYVCHRHGLPLSESSVPIHAMHVKNGARYELPTAGDGQSAHQMGHRDGAWQRSALLIATLSHQLLERNECAVDPQFRSEAYRRKLAEMGYGTRGQLDYDRIMQDMGRFYGERYLHYSNILAGEGYLQRSFIRVFHNTRPAHPLLHLALIGFAFGNLDCYREALNKVIVSGWRKGEFARHTNTIAKFRTDLNTSRTDLPATSQHLAQDYEVPADLKRIISEERSSNTRRTSKQLNAAIRSAYCAGKSRDEIARMFEVHPKTVHNHLQGNPDLVAAHHEACFLRTKDACRRQVSEAISTMEGASRSEIRQKYQNSYNWLYKNDKEWLFTNLPTDRKKQRGQARASSTPTPNLVQHGAVPLRLLQGC